jgi:hypothetical protein
MECGWVCNGMPVLFCLPAGDRGLVNLGVHEPDVRAVGTAQKAALSRRGIVRQKGGCSCAF